MNALGVVIIVFIGLTILLVITRLGRGIASTRRMSGEGYWPADRAEAHQDGGVERGHHGSHNSHHSSHHSHHDIASHHNIGGDGHVGGGHAGGGHHG